MEDKKTQFDDFLNDIDKNFADYFSSDESKKDSIRSYFGTLGGSHLVYYAPYNLRADIKEIVIQKHKEIYGGNATLKETS